jgi:putative CocE/NonD family hydrolase
MTVVRYCGRCGPRRPRVSGADDTMTQRDGKSGSNARRLLGLLLSLALASAAAAGADAVPPGRSESRWLEDNDAPVPMRDGVVLRADVRRPRSGGPFPVLVYRTPYGKHEALSDYTTFEHALVRGYAVVAVDVRGRYASAGEFRPYENEGRDGYDTIEWAAAQPWSNGRVGTFGLSYPGAVQWLAAVEGPPHLKAMVPAMTFSSHRNFFYAGGTWDLSWIEWIWDNIAPDIRVKRDLPGPRTVADAEAAWPAQGPGMQRVVPLGSLAALKGIAPYYYDWMRHPPNDPWWDWADLRGKYGRTEAAVLNLSGWYDDNYGPEGATTNYAGLLAARAGRKPDAALLIGPWVHGVKSTETPKAGERAFAAAAAIDYDATVLDWMDRYLRGLDNGVDRRAPVRYYVMGADTWREAAAWPPAAIRTSFYLGPATAGTPGRLAEAPPPGRATSAFRSDPAHPVVNRYAASGAHDYRELATRSDLLSFDSAPLAADLEVSGPIDAHLYVSCDCRDLDLWVRLYDVAPDGAAWNEMSPGVDVQRASYRAMARGRQLLEPGRIYALDVVGPVTSNVFKRGHRLRVQVSGAFFPNFSRNLQSGEAETDSDHAVPATIRVHQDPAHRSQVVLPIVAH